MTIDNAKSTGKASSTTSVGWHTINTLSLAESGYCSEIKHYMVALKWNWIMSITCKILTNNTPWSLKTSHSAFPYDSSKITYWHTEFVTWSSWTWHSWWLCYWGKSWIFFLTKTNYCRAMNQKLLLWVRLKCRTIGAVRESLKQNPKRALNKCTWWLLRLFLLSILPLPPLWIH